MGLRVLVVDADSESAASRVSEIASSGHEVVRATDLASASEVLMREPIDSIVCSEDLRAEIEHAYAAILPVLPAAGPLAKMLARLTRRSLSPTVQLSLAAQFDEALAAATLALEPVVDLRDGEVRAHRARLLTPTLGADEIFDVACQLGRVLELRRAVRRHACAAIDRGGIRKLVVDATIDDLLDAQLDDGTSPWGVRGPSILLVIAERDVLVLSEEDARDRLRSLRANGFALVSRVGTDIAGLTSVGVVQPAYALVDLAAFGGPGPMLTRVVASVVSACREIEVGVIAEAPTAAHAACARDTGCVMALGRGLAS